MTGPEEDAPPVARGESLRRLLLAGRLPLESETALFILVNALDAVVTISLLYLGGHGEANPVARFFLDHWGPKGIVFYKLAMVAFVCVIAQLIALRSLRTARVLLYGLSALVGAVVAYGLLLLSRAAGVA